MLKVLQIVKRFGPVGGMERYVWELSHALANLGIEVHILCEQNLQTIEHDKIQIHCLGVIPEKPRWWSMLRFSHRVKFWVKNNLPDDFIIHSHERTSVHHMTTFHGNMFAPLRQKSWWKRLSLRIYVWLYLEKRELCGNQVQIVLPNSDLIRAKLDEYYPCIGKKLFLPAYPGTLNYKTVITDNEKSQSNIIIFVGQEWKRKGLEKAVQIVSVIKKLKPDVQFWVLGPKPEDIQHLFYDWNAGFDLLGWQDSAQFLQKSTLLLHPAISEPYGMAIAEATNVGVPVVISNQCGIARQVTAQSGQVVDINSPLDDWVDACIAELNRKSPVKNISQSWAQLAEQHLDIYNAINL